MPDLLTHVLLAYVIATLLSMRSEWLTPQLVTIAMLGAMVPDFGKIYLVVSNSEVESLLGLPFDWLAIHKLGGALVAITIGAMLTSSDQRRRVFLLLTLGAGSHLFLDALLLTPSGYSYAIFWPLSTYHPPTPNLYLSSDRWPALVSGVAAVSVWYLQYHQFGE